MASIVFNMNLAHSASKIIVKLEWAAASGHSTMISILSPGYRIPMADDGCIGSMLLPPSI